MSQRHSEYTRIENDKYETPLWVTQCLVPHIPSRIVSIFDPCCASGKILEGLLKYTTHPLEVSGRDLEHDGYNFLEDDDWHEGIVTNPPFKLAEEFLGRALLHTTFVAMLLRCDYHHAATRQYLFTAPEFAKVIVLTKRIVWFERPGAAPSFNHSWFIFDAMHKGPATVAFAP